MVPSVLTYLASNLQAVDRFIQLLDSALKVWKYKEGTQNASLEVLLREPAEQSQDENEAAEISYIQNRFEKWMINRSIRDKAVVQLVYNASELTQPALIRLREIEKECQAKIST